MGIGHLQGTPWHIEYLKKNETDKEEKRRHKNRCKFYKHYNECELINIHDRCFGSNNCLDYKEKPELKEKNKFEPIDVDKEKQKKKIKQLKSKSEKPKNKKKHKFGIGRSFELEDINTGEIIKYTLVKKEDEDIFNDKIRVDSPLALKVAQANKNELICIETKYFKVEFRVIKIL